MPIDRSDAEFEAAVASVQQDYEEAEVYERGWMPPPGDYVVSLCDILGGTNTDEETGVNSLWIRPLFKILEGADEGRVFRGDSYSNRSPKAFNFMKTVLSQLSGGEITGNLDADLQVVEQKAEAGDTVLTVSVRMRKATTGARAGEEFPNVRIQKVHTDG